MTQAEKLEALVQKAIDDGLPFKEFHIDEYANYIKFERCGEYVGWHPQTSTLLFNKDFARALFKDAAPLYNKDGMPNYLYIHPEVSEVGDYHRQQAVISDDPISYMYKEVFGDE